MHNEAIDFGTSITDVSKGDAFFLDTNFIIACCDKYHKYHKSCSAFYLHLIFNESTLYISEIVIMETLHIMARALYADEQYFRYFHDATHADEERQKEVEKFISEWSIIVKNYRKRYLVGEYNEKAYNIFRNFYADPSVDVFPTDKLVCLAGIELSADRSLLSADALILNLAEKANAEGLVSLDGDFQECTFLKVYSTRIENDFFDINLYQEMEYFEEIKEIFEDELS